MTLRDFIKKQQKVHFRFSDINQSLAVDGTGLVQFVLFHPIERVRGSQSISANGKCYPLEATNVRSLWCVLVNLHEYWHTRVSKHGGGTFKASNLLIDVAKSGKVWLVKTPFNTRARHLV